MKIPTIPKSVLNQSWKIVLLPALLAIFNSVAGHLGYSIKIESENKPADLPLPTEVDKEEKLISPSPINSPIVIENNPVITVENNQSESRIPSVHNPETIPVPDPPKYSSSTNSSNTVNKKPSITANIQGESPEVVSEKTVESDRLISVTMPSAPTKSLLQ